MCQMPLSPARSIIFVWFSLPSSGHTANTAANRDIIGSSCYAAYMSGEEAVADSEYGKSIYRDFDNFLKVAIREYYDRGWATRKGNFIALLISSGSTSFALAKDSVVDGTGTKRVAIGAATVLALRVGLRYALGGPLGLVLTVAASASLVSYFFRNQRDILRRVGVYKTVIKDTGERYEEIQSGWRDGRYDATERNLMIDGLMKRFVGDVDDA